VWNNRQKYRGGYYKNTCVVSRVSYLVSLPHIGKITAQHLARNLGCDIVKYDIWIQRLAVVWSGKDMAGKINNQKLHPDIKSVCDEMFDYLVLETGLPRGYIDVVLWKACQVGLIPLHGRGAERNEAGRVIKPQNPPRRPRGATPPKEGNL
ncbi:MAG: hypothetical protein FWC83_02680, partial [Alphaproteobacteria bacterium]|nr:hypothetical protein [Alphaproteobacteria bacterium]